MIDFESGSKAGGRENPASIRIPPRLAHAKMGAEFARKGLDVVSAQTGSQQPSGVQAYAFPKHILVAGNGCVHHCLQQGVHLIPGENGSSRRGDNAP